MSSFVASRRRSRTAASLLVLAALTGAGCSADVTRFAYLDNGYGGAAAYEAGPQFAQPVGVPVQAQPARVAAAPVVSNSIYGDAGRAALPAPPEVRSAPDYTAPRQVAALPAPAAPTVIAPQPIAPSPVVAAPAPAAPAAPRGGVYTVASGDNLWVLARRYGVSRDAIAAKNGIDAGAPLKIGQRLAMPLPGEAPIAPAPVQIASAAPQASQAPTAATPAVRAPAAPTVVASAPAEAAQAAVKTDVASSATSSGGDDAFKWPVRGRVISEFGSKPDGQKNDGINLVVPEGTPVKASRDGEVIYSGSELEGYGKLILVRHPGNWVTAYAHNSALLVKRGDKVRRGQPVAKAGRTGNVSFPQVHFEIRKGATPVNPMAHLEG